MNAGVVWMNRKKIQGTLADKVKDRRKRCEESFKYKEDPNELSQEIMDQIFTSDLLSLREMIWSKKVTSEQVLKLYYSRSKTEGRKLGAVIDSMFESALKLSQKADILINSKLRSELPDLCGLPLSVKGNYNIKDSEITLGVETRIGTVCTKQSPLIQHLINQGAVPFVRSNIPQLAMASETNNHIYGRCLNPHSPQRTAGGSSGGEAALISGCCSPAGLANDVGGSIRIPALNCGLFGFKGTSKRYDKYDNTADDSVYGKPNLHQGFIVGVDGPIGKSVSDLTLLMKLIADKSINSAIESRLPPLEWKSERTVLSNDQVLTVGYFDSLDDILESCSSSKRALLEVIETLKKLGHKVIKVNPPKKIKEIYKLAAHLSLTNGNTADTFDYSNGLRLITHYKPNQVLYYIPRVVKSAIQWVLKMLGYDRLSFQLEVCGTIPANKLFEQSFNQNRLTDEYLTYLTEMGITHLISPGMAFPALPHDYTRYLSLGLAYSILFNFFDMPTGVLPVTKVRQEEQTYTSKWDDHATQKAKEALKNSAGMPIGVQVSTMPFKDEECLALMKQIEGAMQLKPILCKPNKL